MQELGEGETQGSPPLSRVLKARCRWGDVSRITTAASVFLQVQTVPYRVWCRLELQRRVEEVEEKEAKERLEKALKAANLWEPLWEAGKVEIAPEQGISPPHCNTSKITDPTDSPKWPLEPLLLRWIHF